MAAFTSRERNSIPCGQLDLIPKRLKLLHLEPLSANPDVTINKVHLEYKFSVVKSRCTAKAFLIFRIVTLLYL